MGDKIKIGLIHEGKVPPDYRVALTPSTATRCIEKYPQVDIKVETSPTRCYKDEEYTQHGFDVVGSVKECDILLGVKEVPIDRLIENKTYFFFSHTIKKQAYNRGLLQALINKNIKMIDYEALTDENGKRLIGFGHYAGLVGAHHALRMYGLKFGHYSLKLAHQHFDYAEMIESYHHVTFPAFKVAITGGGNVTKGAIEIMQRAGIQEVDTHTFMTQDLDVPCYAIFEMDKLYVDEKGQFDKKDFYTHPERYKNNFLPVTEVADILINGIFWKASIPKLFEKNDIQADKWHISVISDVTCDPHGSVPINVGASTIADPIYGIHRTTLEKVEPLQNTTDVIDVMTVDNLPNELGRDASQFFSERFENYILPELLLPQSDILDRATICANGRLTERYSYLQDFVDGK